MLRSSPVFVRHMLSKSVLPLLACVLLAAVGCGRPATEEDCRMIFDRSVEVEMRALDRSDTETLTKKKAELGKTFEADLKICVGKRITDSTLACIRGAKTSEELGKCGK